METTGTVDEWIQRLTAVPEFADSSPDSHGKVFVYHYENTPIQIYRKKSSPKTENFQIKISDMFLVSAQNIDCGYSLEPPRRGGSNEYPQSMF